MSRILRKTWSQRSLSGAGRARAPWEGSANRKSKEMPTHENALPKDILNRNLSLQRLSIYTLNCTGNIFRDIDSD